MQQVDLDSELPSLSLCLKRPNLQGSRWIWIQSYLLLAFALKRHNLQGSRWNWFQSYLLLGHTAITARASRLTAAVPDNMSSQTNDCCQRRTVWSTTAYWLFAANLHIYRQSGNPPLADAPHRCCQLPTFSFKNMYLGNSAPRLQAA